MAYGVQSGVQNDKLKAAGYLHNSRNFRWWGSTEELQEEFHFEERLKNMEKELRIALYNSWLNSQVFSS